MSPSNHVILVGATKIKEEVPVPNRYVQWWIYQYQSNTIIYADLHTLMIFDLKEMNLHLICGTSYRLIPICNFRHKGDWTIVDIHPDPVTGIITGLTNQEMNLKTWQELVKLVHHHPETKARINQLRPR